jgi:transglutaminase-like putative cysteine protease
MHYEITHRTIYSYATDVSVSHHVARLTPRTTASQRCVAHELAIDPNPALVTHHDDYFGNRTAFFTVASAHRKLSVTSHSRVEVLPHEAPLAVNTPPWETVRDSFPGNGASMPPEIWEYVFTSSLVPRLPALADYAAESFVAGRPLLDAVLDLMARLHRDFKFDPKATTVATPLEQVIRNRRGVCQDFAHFQIGCLRALNLPARYVSGYMETMPPPGKPKLAGADASHAWVQVFVPGAGWVDVDPTNNLLPSDRHIITAWGRDFDDVSPIRGVIVGGGKHELSVGVDVIPLAEPAVSAKSTMPPDKMMQSQQQQ